MRKALGLWMVVLLCVYVSACASAGGARHVATVTVVSAHSTLALIQDTEMQLACGKPDAPAAPSCVPDDKHKAISAKLAEAFEYDSAAARTVRDWPAGSAPPATLGDYLAKITMIVNYVIGQLPDSALKTKLLTQLGTSH